MPQGDRAANRGSGSYFVPSPLRYFALAVTLIGVVLTFAEGGPTGTYVLAVGLLIAAADDVRRGEPAIGLLVAGLAVMIVASEEDWTAVFYLSAIAILAGAAWALWDARRPQS